MKVLTIVGARPQFVKAALLSRALAQAGIEERLVHTGQHYDHAMSDVFFHELAIPQPTHHLGVGSGSHALQTAQMMEKLDPVMRYEQPDCVIIYGDTNSTLAGALVASKLNLELAHVEAGLRSFDRTMPEEINRLISDRVSTLLLAPTASAAAQLRNEGVVSGVEVVGDMMADLALEMLGTIDPAPLLARFGVHAGDYAVATIHRAANTDDPAVFACLIAGLRRTGMRVIFPVHPRTLALAQTLCVGQDDNIIPCSPLSYGDMLALQANARVLITDSGGMQKEAVIVGTPCVTLRTTTEWTETLEHGWNVLVGSDPAEIAVAANRTRPAHRIMPYGHGDSAQRIVDALERAIPSAERAASCVS